MGLERAAFLRLLARRVRFLAINARRRAMTAAIYVRTIANRSAEVPAEYGRGAPLEGAEDPAYEPLSRSETYATATAFGSDGTASSRKTLCTN